MNSKALWIKAKYVAESCSGFSERIEEIKITPSVNVLHLSGVSYKLHLWFDETNNI